MSTLIEFTQCIGGRRLTPLTKYELDLSVGSDHGYLDQFRAITQRVR